MSKFGNLGKGAPATQAPKGKFDFGSLDDESLLDYGAREYGIPWIDNAYVVQLVDFEYYEGFQFQGPKATLLIEHVAEPGVKRTTPEGKVVTPAQVGEERPFFFRVNEGKVNGFDIGEHSRKQLVNMAYSLFGFDADTVKEAMAKGEFSAAAVLGGLAEATGEEIREQGLRCILEVKTRVSKKSQKFIPEMFFHPYSE